MSFQHATQGAFGRIVAALAALSLALSLSMGALAYSAGDAYAAVHVVEDEAAAQEAVEVAAEDESVVADDDEAPAAAEADEAVAEAASEAAPAAPVPVTATAATAAAADGEQIADEDTPLYSGVPELSRAASPTGSFFWAIMAGIVAVAVYFGMSTSKVNRSIRQMSGKFR